MFLFKVPLCSWSIVATTVMVPTSFPSLLAAMAMLGITRYFSHQYRHKIWNIGYKIIFWFYGHPVVSAMFFAFVGCEIEVFGVFSGRRCGGYRATALAFLAFAAFLAGRGLDVQHTDRRPTWQAKRLASRVQIGSEPWQCRAPFLPRALPRRQRPPPRRAGRPPHGPNGLEAYAERSRGGGA